MYKVFIGKSGSRAGIFQSYSILSLSGVKGNDCVKCASLHVAKLTFNILYHKPDGLQAQNQITLYRSDSYHFIPLLRSCKFFNNHTKFINIFLLINSLYTKQIYLEAHWLPYIFLNRHLTCFYRHISFQI